MMENNKRTEKIMESLGGLHKAEAPPFFYTRLVGKIQNEFVPDKRIFFLLRPAFITTALLVVFIINIFSLTQFKRQPSVKATVQSNKPENIESFAKAYDMNTESVYE